MILFVIQDQNKIIMLVDYVNGLLYFVYVYIIKEHQIGVINQYKILISECEYITLRYIFSENDCGSGIHL